ncbi:MAG: disulfide bond formation protein B [Vicinamibacterales bacterium]|nr:disulfide bond formation protein B [Vicinamibacterales bacterium]
MNRHPVYTVVTLAVLFLAAVPVGIAVFVLGFVYGDSPCVMCWEQRIGMAIIALTGLFIVRYGPRPRYIGVAILTGAWGVHMGIRHSALHVARDIGQGFSIEILGAHTYTWSVFIFWVCIVTMGLLLLWLRDDESTRKPGAFRFLESLAAVVFLTVTAANAVQAFISTGPPPYMGQSDPVRFSLNPKYWAWSLEEWDPRIPVTWRGRWAVDKPSLESLPAGPSTGPLAGAVAVTSVDRRTLALPMRGTITDLAYDGATDRFLVTTQQGVYLTDGSLSRIVRHTVVDPGFAVDLSQFVAGAFLDSQTLIAVADNKSYVVLKEAGQADPVANFRYFLEAPEQFDNISRSRLTTVRARLMYVMSAAYDAGSNSLYTITVPNTKNRRLVISRFDRRDLTLSEEFLPTLATDSGLSLGDKRSLDEYYVTGATVADGVLYALSAAHGTVLSIDLRTRRIVGAQVIPGLDRPTGLAIKDRQFYAVNGDGALVIAPMSR